MQNRLLAALAPRERGRLEPHIQTVFLERSREVIQPGAPIDYCYFPLTCLLSMVTLMADGSTAESGCIGREGMSGLPVILDAGQTSMQTVTQIPGEAVKIPSGALKAAYDASEQLRCVLNRYAHTVVVTGSQSTACNALHPLEARLCRWLLMSSDGIGSDTVALTHEYLATMLGVRRAGVTLATGKLARAGMIAPGRGSIRLLDRDGLHALACECYMTTRDEYERVFGPK